MPEDGGGSWTALGELNKTLINVARNSTNSTGSERMRAALALCALHGVKLPPAVEGILSWERTIT